MANTAGKRLLSSLPGLPVGLPDWRRPGLSEVRVSESPPRGARLVNGAGVRFTKRAMGHEFEIRGEGLVDEVHYGKPQALYMQTMPHLALVDTSTAEEWVTDGAACASA